MPRRKTPTETIETFEDAVTEAPPEPPKAPEKKPPNPNDIGWMLGTRSKAKRTW